MGSTNKTANLGLSQYIGTDKPTWLVDYNNDMAVIDEAIGELQNDSGLTDTAIAELQTNVQNLQSGQGDSATEIAEVKSSVQTLSANYETIHHEVVLLDENVNTLNENVNTLDENVNTLDENVNDFIKDSRYIQVYIDSVNGNDNNAGTETAPFKTIEGALVKYHVGALDIKLMSGTYTLPLEMRSLTYIIISTANDNQSPILTVASTIIIANKVRINKGVTIEINSNTTFDMVNFILSGKLVVNAGYKLIMSGAMVTVGQTAKITGDGTLELVRCFTSYSTGASVDVTNLHYIISLVFDKGYTITSNVTNTNSIRSSEILV